MSTPRIETLVKQARQDLDDNQYREFSRNGESALEIARAVDKIRDAERVLRRAYATAARFEKVEQAS